MQTATIDRWTVTQCQLHGLMASRSRCPLCGSALGEPFVVVRAVGARTTDPNTSKLAALRQAPRSSSQRGRILSALKASGPMSARQIELATGISGAWKRVSELKQGGHVYEARVERDPQTRTEVAVYAIAEGGDGEPLALF